MIKYGNIEVKRKHWDAYENMIRVATANILKGENPMGAVSQVLVASDALLKELRDHARDLEREVFTDEEGPQK